MFRRWPWAQTPGHLLDEHGSPHGGHHLPDPADRVRRCPKGDDPRPRRCFDDGRGLRLRDTFWMNTDHPMVDTTFLDRPTGLGAVLKETTPGRGDVSTMAVGSDSGTPSG